MYFARQVHPGKLIMIKVSVFFVGKSHFCKFGRIENIKAPVKQPQSSGNRIVEKIIESLKKYN